MKSSSFNTVTTFSKITAALLFIILPMVTLFIGMEYQKRMMMSFYKTMPSQSACLPASAITTNNEIFGRSYVHARGKYMIQYPFNWRVYDFEHEMGEPTDAISSISIRNEQSKYNTFISVKVNRDTIAHYKSVIRKTGVIKETSKYELHDAVGTREVIEETNFDVIYYLLERKGLLYEISLNVLKSDPGKTQEVQTLEKIFSTLGFNDYLTDNCKQ